MFKFVLTFYWVYAVLSNDMYIYIYIRAIHTVLNLQNIVSQRKTQHVHKNIRDLLKVSNKNQKHSTKNGDLHWETVSHQDTKVFSLFWVIWSRYHNLWCLCKVVSSGLQDIQQPQNHNMMAWETILKMHCYYFWLSWPIVVYFLAIMTI